MRMWQSNGAKETKPGGNTNRLMFVIFAISGETFSKAHFALRAHIFLLEKTPCFDTSSTHQNWLLNTENSRPSEEYGLYGPPNFKSPPVIPGGVVRDGRGGPARLPVPMTPCHGLNG